MGKRLKMIIARGCNKKADNEIQPGLPYEDDARRIMSDHEYRAYLERNGNHFSEALAEHASSKMVNADDENHSWTAKQVKKVMDTLGYTLPSHATLGDATYLANMYYADLYPDPLATESACIKAMCKTLNDPDGYEGQAFCRWQADIIAKGEHIDWDNF